MRMLFICLIAVLLSGEASAQRDENGVFVPTNPSLTPVLEDQTQPWLAGTRRTLRVRISGGMPGTRITGVSVRYARHHWPGAERAHRAEARRVTGRAGLWEVTPSAAVAALQADSLFHEWHVSYDQSGRGQLNAISTLQEQTVGCAAGAIRTSLINLQRAAGRFDVTHPHLVLPNLGYPAPTHGMASLGRIGFSMARTGVAMGTSRVRFGVPDLLMYAPRPRRVNETRAAYRRALTDQFPDPPYRLIGWVHAQPQTSTQRRPRLGCVPSKHWFLHEAGYHQPDGGFLPTPPRLRERFVGETLVRTQQDILRPNPFSGIWHPRIWDLHLWVDPDPACGPNCPPIVQRFAPIPVVGLSTPANTFPIVETFE